MKNYYLIIIVLLFSLSLQAQDEDFNVEEEIEFLKEEIANLENEIIEAEDPEEKAELEKEMAILKRSQGMLEKNKTTLMSTEVKNAHLKEVYMFQVPDIDQLRISKISLEITNEAQLVSHLNSTAMQVNSKIPENIKSLGLQLSDAAKDLDPDSVSTGDLAIGLWMMGSPDLALYMQSLACGQNPSRNDWLNNYAAMLTMMGGEEYALPILQRLDNLNPNNPITLNNIGMVWFGLGALDKAEQYLDSSIKCVGNHSQAKMAKALIEEHKGNKQAAVELVKESLGEGYSEDKENHLRKMGIDPDGSYIRGTDELKDEYLGLQQFINLIPAYPKSATDLAKAQLEWSLFQEKISALDAELIQNIEEYEPIHQRAMDRFYKGEMERSTTFSPFAKKYIARNLKRLIQPTIEEVQLKPKLIEDKFRPDFLQVEALREKLTEFLKEDIPEEVQCRAVSEFVSYANEVRSNYNGEVVRFWKRTINTMAQYHKYYLTPTPETYQYTLMNLEENFVSILAGLNYEPWNAVGTNCSSTPAAAQKTGILPYFEDIHCDKHSEFNLPGLGTIITNCHYMETNFDPYMPLPLELKYKLKDDLLTGQNIGGSVTVEYGFDMDKVPIMPLKIETEANVSTTIEWDSNGISDVSVTGELKVQAGIDQEDSGIKNLTLGGVSSTVSLQSGPSSQLKSAFLK